MVRVARSINQEDGMVKSQFRPFTRVFRIHLTIPLV